MPRQVLEEAFRVMSPIPGITSQPRGWCRSSAACRSEESYTVLRTSLVTETPLSSSDTISVQWLTDRERQDVVGLKPAPSFGIDSLNNTGGGQGDRMSGMPCQSILNLADNTRRFHEVCNPYRRARPPLRAHQLGVWESREVSDDHDRNANTTSYESSISTELAWDLSITIGMVRFYSLP